ncbi:uncharacterized protein N7482_009373 [Penicillium canariense]|uniref:RRM domain-containing protein n=1 Tax=Penicillium canariense TaxID=189055 RepID=A0A9W9HQ93_9EURO|nr:uncharacterized protein N7482_009373 [Penicillium canariense]KAJ5152895.1 hypothetical protein N7482_009373 [Penicillium canariense]
MTSTEVADSGQKKRKLQDGPELEIDISAPEPQSKKALRKAKKSKQTDGDAADTDKPKPDKPESKDATDSQAKRSDYGVWVGNLSFNTTKDDLREFFMSNCSFSDDTITRVHMPKGAERFGRPQNKGFAYVDFSTQTALDAALGLSEQLVAGRRVLIKNAKSFEGRPEKSDQGNAATSAKPGHPPSRRIFVGNLSFDVTKESLEEHFGRCGTVANVHMATFQDTGKCKGYAWVEFEEIESAESAVKGFVMVKEDESEAEEEEQPSDSSDSDGEEEEKKKKPKKKSKKSKKPSQHRVWVNQLMGRRMRMEFAEDASTRYKKRFGKDGEGKKNGQPAITEDNGSEPSEERPRVRKQRRPSIDESRYTKETVQRLSGAIVEGQGKKVTFD